MSQPAQATETSSQPIAGSVYRLHQGHLYLVAGRPRPTTRRHPRPALSLVPQPKLSSDHAAHSRGALPSNTKEEKVR
jgi:hypothetical protein